MSEKKITIELANDLKATLTNIPDGSGNLVGHLELRRGANFMSLTESEVRELSSLVSGVGCQFWPSPQRAVEGARRASVGTRLADLNVGPTVLQGEPHE